MNATISDKGLAITRDVAYAPGARHALDIYRPSSLGRPAPVVVFFYGGSWQSGAKDEYLFVAAALARRGFVVIVPDYRIYPEARFPGFMADGAEAVAWTRAHARDYGGDPDDITLAGHSAGAYIAVLLALDPEYLNAAGVDPRVIAGTVGISGPYDFLPIRDPAIQAVFADARSPAATQPINFADGRNKPMLLVTGDDDHIVGAYNTEHLVERIRAEGGPVDIRTYHGVGHIGIILAFAPEFKGNAPVLEDVANFISRLGPKATAAK